MKILLLTLVAILALTAPALFAADHTGHGMNYGNYTPGKTTHQEVIDGVKATFNVTTMKEAMKEMGMALPKGVKETHHISVSFNDMKTGTAVTAGEVKIKLQAPDKSMQTKVLPAMHGHFGADFDLAKKGKYGVMCSFVLKDGKNRSSNFWYTVK